jgi:hypothetical protein
MIKNNLTPSYLGRFAELYERLGLSFVIVNGKMWSSYKRMIVPVGPPHLDYSISENKSAQLFRYFPEAVLVRHTGGFEPEKRLEDGWYAVISENCQDLESLSSKTRSEIRRGLKNCVVRQVEANYIAEHGYNVYLAAFERYQGIEVPASETNFKKDIRTKNSFDDLLHYWAVFHQDKLVAFATNRVYGTEAIDYSIITFDPKYLKLYPSYALIYSMNRYYLVERRYSYVNDGFRSIYHESNIQQYLIKKFSFKKMNVKLNITYKNLIHYLIYFTFPFRKILGEYNHKLKALYKLEEIRRSAGA